MKLAILSRAPKAYSTRRLKAAALERGHQIRVLDTFRFAIDNSDHHPELQYRVASPEGTQGIGVILAPDRKVAEAVVETLQSTRQNVLIQRFITESKGRDIRALVVGDRVVGAMRRSAVGDEFRSNVHRGGTTEVVELDDEYQRVAVQAAQIMGLRVAGVDMLEGDDGPLVMEVNSSPGLEGIEGATDLDIAGAIVDYIASHVAFPELDVRQRLTVSTGYGVAEISVRQGASILGSTIEESGLRERDIAVLTRTKGTHVIPNPKGSRVLEVDDRLLCFGKLEAMRDLVPERRRRRGRTKVQPLPHDPTPGIDGPAETSTG